MTQTMPLLKEVGTKLGLETGKTGYMRNVAAYVNQHRGELIRKEQILSDLNLQDKDKPAIENCFHRGYILRGQNSGNDFYFIPKISDGELINLRNEFQQLETFPDKKKQLIQNLIENMASPSQATSNIPNNNASPQTPPSQEGASQQSGTDKIAVQKEIEKLEKEKKTLDKALKVMESYDPQVMDLRQDIKKTEEEIAVKDYLLSVYREKLGNIP